MWWEEYAIFHLQEDIIQILAYHKVQIHFGDSVQEREED